MEEIVFPSRPRHQLHAHPGQIVQSLGQRPQAPEAVVLQHPPIEAETHPGGYHHHLSGEHLGDWQHSEAEVGCTDVLLPFEWTLD